MRLVTADEMRRLDAATIAGGHATGEALMRRAGAGVAERIERRWGPVLGFRVLVLCGTGNNGGDGFVAARELEARGAEVHVGILGDPGRVRDDARTHLEALRAAGVAPVATPDAAALERLVAARDRFDFAIDALLGTGARGAPQGVIADGIQTLRELDERGTHVIAVDLPSGMDADTGEIARRTVRADLTVTFGAPKRGHFLYPGRAFVGALEVVDIGLVDAWGPDDDPARRVAVTTAPPMAALVPHRAPRAHKNSVGRLLVIGGSPGLTGAVALAARGAARAGAGYVIAAVPASLHDVFEAKLTETVTLPLAEGDARAPALAALPLVLAQGARADAVTIGSGLSRDADAAELVRRVAAELARPLVIDADGLNAFAGRALELGTGPRAADGAPVPRVITPHLGEAARLSGLDADAIESRRIDLAREWAAQWNVVVVLKGAPTVIADPSGRATVNPTGNPALATAGTGDVLCGMIAALIGQGLAPYDAARLAVFVHGMAADRLAARIGTIGVVAGDVAEEIPATLFALTRIRDAGFASRA